MSQKTVFQKLLIKDNYRILLINEPEGYRSALGHLLKSVVVVNRMAGEVDLIQVFVTSKKELEDQLAKLKPILSKKTLLWVTYPKGTSNTKVDINRDVIREYAQSIELQAVALVAVDETWSALRLKSP